MRVRLAGYHFGVGFQQLRRIWYSEAPIIIKIKTQTTFAICFTALKIAGTYTRRIPISH